MLVVLAMYNRYKHTVFYFAGLRVLPQPHLVLAPYYQSLWGEPMYDAPNPQQISAIYRLSIHNFRVTGRYEGVLSGRTNNITIGYLLSRRTRVVQGFQSIASTVKQDVTFAFPAPLAAGVCEEWPHHSE